MDTPEIIYQMPGQDHRLFINVVHACPNACLFCVDFKGDAFYGFDLKQTAIINSDQIVSAIEHYPCRDNIAEVYFCGIGEPLLRYETVVDAAKRIRSLFSPKTLIAVNTSGTFYKRHPRVDFVQHFDLIQVSLNAESEEKYNAICRPKVKWAYQALMSFLSDLKTHLMRNDMTCRVELSVVDTTEVNNLPIGERGSTPPKPDIEQCKIIADNFGWPLKVKKLIKDCEDDSWHKFADEVRNYRAPIN